MLQAIDLSVEVDALQGPLFTHITFTIARGEKVALVGPNGSGKSTLLRALLGEIPPRQGRVVLSRGCRLSYLPQEVLEAEPQPYGHRALPTQGQTSPGERMRLALNHLLADNPDILLLDEPTNHLDAPALDWLTEFLRSCRQGVLVVTHDRKFADDVAERIIELSRGAATEYAGGYSDMLAQKHQQTARDLADYQRTKKDLRRLRDAAERIRQKADQVAEGRRAKDFSAFSKPFYQAKGAAMQRRANAVVSRVERAAESATPKPFEADSLVLEFPTRALRSSYALQARRLCKSYGHRNLFADFTLDVEAGERVAIVGPNGAGKTTLLQGLLDPSTLDSGEVVWGRNALPALLSQERLPADPSQTILDYLAEYDGTQVRTALGSLGMRGDAALKQVGVLSVGERSRVELVRILLSGANVLLLDEPTNHLDIASLEALESALKQFTGSVIFVSHDRRFIETNAERILRLGA